MRTQGMPRSNNVTLMRGGGGSVPIGKGAGQRQAAFRAPVNPEATKDYRAKGQTAFRQHLDRDHDNVPWLIQNRMNNDLGSLGRGGDTELAHVNPQEAAVLKGMGGSGTINPNTGLREYKYGADTREGGASGLGRSGPGTGGSGGGGGGGGWGGRIGTGLGMALGTLAGGPAGGVLGAMGGRWAGNKLGGVLGGGAGAGGPAGAGASPGATGGSGNAVRDLFHSTAAGGGGLSGPSANASSGSSPAAIQNPYGIPQRPADYSFINPQSLIARPPMDGGQQFGQGMETMNGGGPGRGAFAPNPNMPSPSGAMFNPGMNGSFAPQQAPYTPPMQVPLPWPLAQNQQQPMPTGFGGIRG